MSDPKPDSKDVGWWAQFLMYAIAAVWAYTFLLAWPSVRTSETLGQFGDAFGSINALFSGLASLR